MRGRCFPQSCACPHAKRAARDLEVHAAPSYGIRRLLQPPTRKAGLPFPRTATNRYFCDEEVYFKELIRYVHLNPLRAGLVDDLVGLDHYPWCGHVFVVNGTEHPWHDVSFVLSRFGEKSREARRSYKEFLAGGIREDSGSAKGTWRSDWSLLEWLKEVRPTGNVDVNDREGRVLGGEKFVKSLIIEKHKTPGPDVKALEELIRGACRKAGLSVEELLSGRRRANVAEVRAQLVRQLVAYPDITLTDIGFLVGVSKSGVYRILERKG